MKRYLLVLLIAACGDTTTNPVDQLNLDRPVDIAFACYGGLRITNGGGDESATTTQAIEITAQPEKACEIRSTRRDAGAPIVVPPGQQDLRAQGGDIVPNASWYGLILQQGPGTIAITQFPAKDELSFSGNDNVVVLDADPLTPGKNSISVGEDPVALITDTVGCSAITANAGSCDLSLMDISSALDLDGRVDVARLEVTNAAGVPIHAKPAAIVGEPKSEVIGESCPVQQDQSSPRFGKRVAEGVAYIAYPGCHLVAGVDLATGKIFGGIQFAGATATILADGNVTCPEECGVGSLATPGPRPSTIDLEADPLTGSRKLVVGAENSNQLTVVDLDVTSKPLSVFQIPLEGSTVGLSSIALSKVIGVGGVTGSVDDANADSQAQFVYGVATDQTVRVVEVLTKRTECDTQADPRFVRQGQSATTFACFAVGDVNTPPRRAGAKGPGIVLGRDQIPLSVDIITQAVLIPNDPRGPGTPSKMIGHFAIVSAISGETFVITIDDDDFADQFDATRPLSAPISYVMPHQVRDAIDNRFETAVDDDEGGHCSKTGPVLTSGGFEAGPRAANNPVRNIPSGFVAPEKTTQLPGIRQLTCMDDEVTKPISELLFSAPEDQRDLEFADLHALALDENWTLTWEGSLSVDTVNSAVNGPVIRESMLYVDPQGMHLRNQTKPYCDAGVEPFDIVQVRGCDPSLGSTDCPTGYSCFVHPQSQVQGIGACLKADEADRLADACKDFLTSIRRYTVAKADSGELLLMERRHELRTTPLDGCTSDQQCEDLADLSARSALSLHPSDPVEQMTTDARTWVCRADPQKAPRGTSNNRCNLSCDSTADCASGTVCKGGNAATPDVKEGLCMEGVVPPQACVNAPQRYELRGGEAFIVAGARSGYVHSIIADPTTRACIKDPAAHPLQTGRIPLNPPACNPLADPVTGRLPAPMQNTYDANPCMTTTTHSETLPRYIAGTCTLDDPNSQVVERQATAIRYRGPGLTLTLVNPTYPGDNKCILDREGPGGVPLVNIPQVFPGYAVSFRLQAGFNPLRLPIAPVFPVKVVRGPLDSIWVVDEGDFLSTSISLPSTRGKVFRVEGFNINVTNTLD